MLYLGRVVEGGVHIAVTVCVRDALHGFGGGFSQRNCGEGAFVQVRLELLTGFLCGFLPCFLTLDAPLQPPLVTPPSLYSARHA